MDSPMWHDSDDALMQELKEAFARERAVPEHVMEAARAAYDWRGLDDELELLTLSFDSLVADAAGVRGPAKAGPRMLVFDGEKVTIELELGDDVLMGQVVPARSDRVIVESADGRVDEADADDAGFFLLRRPAHGPIRLKLRQAVGVVTGWISI
jgi:hypothetical protein